MQYRTVNTREMDDFERVSSSIEAKIEEEEESIGFVCVCVCVF